MLELLAWRCSTHGELAAYEPGACCFSRPAVGRAGARCMALNTCFLCWRRDLCFLRPDALCMLLCTLPELLRAGLPL